MTELSKLTPLFSEEADWHPSIYAVEDPASVCINPTGVSRDMACETKWALHTLLGVDRRRGPDTDVRDRGKAMHAFVDRYVRHYARTGELSVYSGRYLHGLEDEDEDLARDVFAQLEDDEGIKFEEQTCHDLLAAVRVQLPLIGLDKFTVVHHDGVPLVELDLRATIDGVQYQAIVDAVLRHRVTGEVWVTDWKTTDNAIDITKTPNYVEHDMQLALQRWLLEANGVKVDRSALCQIRSIAPQPPELTKRKKLTRDLKKLSCDADTYRDALIANNEDPFEPKTAEKLKQLERCVYVRWLPDITTAAAHRALVAEIKQRATGLMQIARGERQPLHNVRNVTGHAPYVSGCRRCDYDKWCLAALRNGGVPDLSLVGVDYKRNDKATFTAVPSSTPKPADEAYGAYTANYGHKLHPLEVFTP